MTITPDTIRCRRDAVAAEILDGEAMIMNLETGVYYSLQRVGARIWHCIEQEQTTAHIAHLIAAEYSTPLPQVQTDLAALVAELLDEQLVTAGGSSPEPAPVVPFALVAAAPAYERPVLHKFTDMADMLALDPPLPGLMDIQWKPTGKS